MATIYEFSGVSLGDKYVLLVKRAEIIITFEVLIIVFAHAFKDHSDQLLTIIPTCRAEDTVPDINVNLSVVSIPVENQITLHFGLFLKLLVLFAKPRAFLLEK